MTRLQAAECGRQFIYFPSNNRSLCPFCIFCSPDFNIQQQTLRISSLIYSHLSHYFSGNSTSSLIHFSVGYPTITLLSLFPCTRHYRSLVWPFIVFIFSLSSSLYVSIDLFDVYITLTMLSALHTFTQHYAPYFRLNNFHLFFLFTLFIHGALTY